MIKEFGGSFINACKNWLYKFYLYSCDHNQYSLQYIISLSENKRKRSAATGEKEGASDNESDSEIDRLIHDSDSEGSVEQLGVITMDQS